MVADNKIVFTPLCLCYTEKGRWVKVLSLCLSLFFSPFPPFFLPHHRFKVYFPKCEHKQRRFFWRLCSRPRKNNLVTTFIFKLEISFPSRDNGKTMCTPEKTKWYSVKTNFFNFSLSQLLINNYVFLRVYTIIEVIKFMKFVDKFFAIKAFRKKFSDVEKRIFIDVFQREY